MNDARAQGRGRGAGENGRDHRRSGPSPGNEAALLRALTMKSPALEDLIEAAALHSRHRPEVRPAHRLPSAAARTRPGRQARGRPGAGVEEACRRCAKCNTFAEDDLWRAVRLAQARQLAAVRGRDARGPADDGADPRVQRSVLRAHGGTSRRSTVSTQGNRPGRDAAGAWPEAR